MATQPQSADAVNFIQVPFDRDEVTMLEAAVKSTGQTLSEFAHEVTLKAAREIAPVQRPRRSAEEMKAIFAETQAFFKAANTEGRDLVAELIAERRAEAARE